MDKTDKTDSIGVAGSHAALGGAGHGRATDRTPQQKHRVGSTSLPLSIYTNLGLASLLSLLCDRHVVSGDRVIREKLGCIWICISLTVTLLCVLKVSVCPHRTCHNYP